MFKRLRVSLRALLFTTALFSVLAAVLSAPARTFLSNKGILRFAQSPNFDVNVEESPLFGDIKVGHMSVTNETIDDEFVANLEKCGRVRWLRFSHCVVDADIVHRLECSSGVEFINCVFRGSIPVEQQPYRMMMAVSYCTPSQTVRDLIQSQQGGALTLCPPAGEDYPWISDIGGFSTLFLSERLRCHVPTEIHGVKYWFIKDDGSLIE